MGPMKAGRRVRRSLSLGLRRGMRVSFAPSWSWESYHVLAWLGKILIGSIYLRV